jgi:hypothetical protein
LQNLTHTTKLREEVWGRKRERDKKAGVVNGEIVNGEWKERVGGVKKVQAGGIYPRENSGKRFP